MSTQNDVAGQANTLHSRSEADLISLLSQKVIGQSPAMKFIVPYVYMWQAGQLSSAKETVCQQPDIPILHKPFPVTDVLRLIGYRFARSATSTSS